MTTAKILANLKKIHHWGWRGVKDYLKERDRIKNIQSQLLASRNTSAPVRGITLIGEFTAFGSHSKVLRDLATKLHDAQIPYQTFDTTKAPSPILTAETQDVLTASEDFCINRFSLIVEILPTVVPAAVQIPRARIAFWEFESGFLYGYPDMTCEKHVIAMSDFNAAYFRRILPASIKVSKLLYPFQGPPADVPSAAKARTAFGIPASAFTVLFNFDFGSGFNRKNPDGALRAFAQAFAGNETTRLVLKTKSADAHSDRVQALKTLAEQLGVARQLIIVNSNISQRDLYGLVNACDVYLSLHRGEGFGITLAEAMAMGKPVVTTDWSSTTEFCKYDCTMPIPYKIVPVRPDQIDHQYYQKLEAWAEPSIDAAAAALKRLRDNPDLRAELGSKAIFSIQEQFALENFRASIEAVIQA